MEQPFFIFFIYLQLSCGQAENLYIQLILRNRLIPGVQRVFYMYLRICAFHFQAVRMRSALYGKRTVGGIHRAVSHCIRPEDQRQIRCPFSSHLSA